MQLLDSATRKQDLTELERAGLVQFFEIAVELSWKAAKDWLEAQGLQPAGPRDSLKMAYASGLIADGHVWLQALHDRNMATHTYDEASAAQLEMRIRTTYLSALHAIVAELKVRE
ncbi:MAG: nucleotidyltransferase substrate binding protein [Deltaproteobacteria bacterium]|nr:nucleotidyltransferase substrate binding protein [Deltaproteobacteria bacterium]